MTTVNATGAQSYWNQLKQTGTVTQNSGGTGKTVSGGHHHHASGSNDLIDAIQTSLSQIGLNLNTYSQATDQTDQNAISTAATPATTGTTTATQALQAFLHDLFTAVQDQTGGATGAANGAYASTLTNGLQGIISALSNNNLEGTNPSLKNDLSTLQSDFSTLVTATGGGAAPAGGQATPPTLSAFLQNLVQNLQGTPTIAGSTLNGFT